MLKFYLITVVIWMIIIYAMAAIFESSIKEKSWLKDKPNKKRGLLSSLFLLAAVPVMRLFVCICILMMAVYTPEQLEEMKKRGNEDGKM